MFDLNGWIVLSCVALASFIDTLVPSLLLITDPEQRADALTLVKKTQLKSVMMGVYQESDECLSGV